MLTLPEHELPILNMIKRHFIDGNPVVVQEDFEGQGIDESGKFILGCKSGPEISVSNLLHEMAHLAEREIPKLLKKPSSSWGFNFGKYWELCGKSGYEPTTDKSVRREMRVWAYQSSLELFYLKKCDVRQLVISAVYLPAFCYYKNKVLGKHGLGYTAPVATPLQWSEVKAAIRSESENKTLDIMAEEVGEMSETNFTYKHFCEVWQERMNALVIHEDKL